MAQVLVAVCTFDRYPLLERALTALRAHRADSLRWRMLVVDNSPDAARAAAEQARWAGTPDLDYRLEPVPGIANARNVALAAAEALGARHLVFLDDDAVPHAGWLEALIAAFDSPAVGAVGGQVVLEWTQPRPPWLHDLALPYLSRIDWGSERRAITEQEWLVGANLAFEVAALRAVGGFDAALGRSGGGATLVSNEESAALRRLRAGGFVLNYEPGAVVDHLVHAERVTQDWFRRRAAWQAVSDYLEDPQRAFRRAAAAWHEIEHYSARLPPWRRGLKSLEREVADPRLFMKQIHAIYLLTLKQLAGFPPEA